MLYVVLAESGEYSDRWVWVAAVYHTEAEARAAMQAAIERRGVWEAWYESWPALREGLQKRSAHAELEPPKERGERFQIVEIEPGKWGEFYDEFEGWKP